MKRASGQSWQDLLMRGVALHKAGKLAEAEKLYDKVLKYNRGSGDALNLKGVIASSRGHHAAALKLYDGAVAAMPAYPEGHFNRAVALAALERNEEALAAYGKAIALNPRYGDAYLNAGLAHHKLGQLEKAVAAFRKTVELSPNDPRGPYNLGVCLQESLPGADAARRAALTAEATVAFERALALDPGSAAVLYGFATLHSENGDHARAAALVEAALRVRPEWSDAWNNLGNHYEGLGRRAEAVAAFDRALALDPRNMGAVVNRGLTLLALGNMAAGWEGYAHRFDDPRFPFSPRSWPWPAWRGEDLAGKRILLWSDQGIGDEVLYASMVREVAARAGACVLECTDRLVPLYLRSFPGIEIAAKLPEVHAALMAGAFDYHCSVLDLGRWLRPALNAFPNRGPLLTADPDRTAALRAKYRQSAPATKLVGLSWHSTNPRIGDQKSHPLDWFRPLLTLPEFTFINIQYGNVSKELDDFSRAGEGRILSDPEIDSLKDLDAFAAQLAALDAVVSVSNSAAHLAGALGVPTAVLIPDHHKRLWYWFDRGAFSPWYRSIRVFRDSGAGALTGLRGALAAIGEF